MKKTAYEIIMSMSSDEERWTYVEEHQDDFFPEVRREQWDAYCAVKEDVSSRARELVRKELNIKDDDRPLGLCHSIWERMKTIFKEEYNIDWKSPAECNPDARFD